MPVFLLCSFLMIILYPVGIDLYLVAVPQIADTLQASEAQIHTAFSIYLFGMAATVLLGGMIADRYGRRWVVLGGALTKVMRKAGYPKPRKATQKAADAPMADQAGLPLGDAPEAPESAS
ncbi:TPA: MFS transporter [Escherichia coli]